MDKEIALSEIMKTDKVMKAPKILKEGTQNTYVAEVDNKHYLIGNVKDKDKIFENLFKANLDYCLKTNLENPKYYITNTFCKPVVSNADLGFDSPEFKIWEKLFQYIALYEFMQADRTVLNEALTDFFKTELERKGKLECKNATELDIFKDEGTKSAYVWNFFSYNSDVPNAFNIYEVADLMTFVRDYNNPSNNLLNRISKDMAESYLEDNPVYAINFLQQEAPVIFTELMQTGKITVDYDGFIKDLRKFTEKHSPDYNVKDFGYAYREEDDHIICELSEFNYKTLSYLIDRENNVYQNWSVKATFYSYLTENEIKDEIKLFCEKEHTNIKEFYIKSPADTSKGNFEVDFKAEHIVHYFEDKSVGINCEFQDAWTDKEDIKEWFKETAQVKDTLDYDIQAEADDTDTLYQKYCDINKNTWEAEDKYYTGLGLGIEDEEKVEYGD